MFDESGGIVSEESKALEREACALVKQYGFFMPSPVKGFLAKMAIFLNWQELQKGLNK